VDLWYGATGDIEWYDSGQVTTRGGSLVITMDSTSKTQAGLTNGVCLFEQNVLFHVSVRLVMVSFLFISISLDARTYYYRRTGSTAPFTAADNHNLDYRSGMLQTLNKFCFTTRYVEVSATFPGPDQIAQGYVSLLIVGLVFGWFSVLVCAFFFFFSLVLVAS